MYVGTVTALMILKHAFVTFFSEVQKNARRIEALTHILTHLLPVNP